MLQPRILITRIITTGVALALATFPVAPLVAADMTPPDANGNSCFIVGSDQAGNHKPVGADANLFSYNCSTNLWESSHYTYDPITHVKSPKDPVVYTYNPSTGLYDTQTWDFSATQGDYVLTPHSASTPPAGVTVIGGPPPPVQSINNTGDGSTNTIANTGNPGGSQTINNTGAGSTNSIGSDGLTNTTLNNNNTVTLDTTSVGQAISGNAIVLANTTGGSANTGNALDQATIVNMLQSSSNQVGTGNTVTFIANIDGNVDGDLLLNPAALGSVQSASAPGTNNLTINNSTDASINNNVTLAANSGDATVSKNTTAGDATTGSAEAIANVVNLINSAITSGQSFIGTININGNLNGDILVPQNLYDQLLADNVPQVTISNTGASSNNSVTNTGGQNTTVNNTNNLGINNNVTSGANSGNANVDGNTTAGNATTGTANTSITAFNLTGSNVVGSNDLLVFVNVVGTWVGMIINAPAGATAAEMGGGVTTNNNSDSTTVNNNTNEQINNNINLAAKSGNANVTDNTTAGNAKTGNAGTAANLLNIQNSSLSFSGWFGILFINVFGTWHGNFGVLSNQGKPSTSSNTSNNTTNGPSVAAAVQVFGFLPHSPTSSSSNKSGSAPTSTISNTGNGSSNFEAALAAKTSKAAPAPRLQSNGHPNMILTVGALTLFVIYVAADTSYTHRKAARAS
jgi:hypothetical protein